MEEQENKQQLLAETLHIAREATIIFYAMQNGLPHDDGHIVDRRSEFYHLTQSEQNQYRIRPNRDTVAYARSSRPLGTLARELARQAVETYRTTGDAAHAMDSIGIPLKTKWIEQNRNAQGIVEVLMSDVFVRREEGLSPAEVLESSARDNGLYDDKPVPDDEAGDTETVAERLLTVARERIPPRDLAAFLLVVVDGTPLRVVAREMEMSYRQVWQTVEQVREWLIRIAAEEGFA